MSQQEQKLESILRNRGLGWAIDIFAPSSDAAGHYLNALDQLKIFIQDRGLGSISFSPDALENLISVSSYKADAFLQALVSVRGTEMLCATWRILQGMEIVELTMNYQRLSNFELRVVLQSPYGESEEYISHDINDVVFVRHLGKSTMSDKPMFNGFFALRQT